MVSNKYTKLQTESGNYHVDFMLPDTPATTDVEGDAYKKLALLIMLASGKKPVDQF